VARAELDLLIETYEKKIGPHNGARVVANGVEFANPADIVLAWGSAMPHTGKLSPSQYLAGAFSRALDC
jgi:hypothetical protein